MSKSYSLLPNAKCFRDSSGSLRRESSSIWSFPKAERFLSNSQISDVPLLQLPSTLECRFTTQGKGSRYSMVLNDNPPPNLYNIPSQFNPLQRKPGVVFGPIPFHTSKVYKSTPGPGTYEVAHGFISKEKGVKLKSRKILIDHTVENPAPNSYHINEKIVIRGRFKDISMGKGKRHDFFNKSKKIFSHFGAPGPWDLQYPIKI